MDPFPFTNDEWDAVYAMTIAITDAIDMGDEVLLASRTIELFDFLEDLRSRYGEHPVLLETEADFSDGFTQRSRLYASAIALAETHRLPTLSIRLSLASDLLEAGRSQQAKDELAACESELPGGDDSDRSTWHELFASASSQAAR